MFSSRDGSHSASSSIAMSANGDRNTDAPFSNTAEVMAGRGGGPAKPALVVRSAMLAASSAAVFELRSEVRRGLEDACVRHVYTHVYRHVRMCIDMLR